MITIKEEFLTCDKVRRAVKASGSDAVVMWLALKAYCSEYLTDGFIPNNEVDDLPGAPRRNRKRAIRALVECGRIMPTGERGAGLVEVTEHGLRLHDYLDHAESGADIRERRRREAERKRDYRARKRNDSGNSVPMSPTGQGAGQPEDGTRDGRGCPVGDSPAGARTRVPTPPHSTQLKDPPNPPAGGDESDARIRKLWDHYHQEHERLRGEPPKFTARQRGQVGKAWKDMLGAIDLPEAQQAVTRALTDGYHIQPWRIVSELNRYRGKGSPRASPRAMQPNHGKTGTEGATVIR